MKTQRSYKRLPAEECPCCLRYRKPMSRHGKRRGVGVWYYRRDHVEIFATTPPRREPKDPSEELTEFVRVTRANSHDSQLRNDIVAGTLKKRKSRPLRLSVTSARRSAYVRTGTAT
jgi:hypothetical protein